MNESLLSCTGKIVSAETEQKLKFSVYFSIENGNILRAKEIVAGPQMGRFLKYLFLPSTDPLEMQNKKLVGVDSLVDIKSPVRRSFEGVFLNVVEQQDNLLSKSQDELEFSSTWRPIAANYVGRFTAERNIKIRIQTKIQRLEYTFIGRDYFDEEAFNNNTWQFKFLKSNLTANDAYKATVSCK